MTVSITIKILERYIYYPIMISLCVDYIKDVDKIDIYTNGLSFKSTMNS